MTTFLFWNLNGKPLEAIVANLASRHDVDVLMFVECAIEVSAMLSALNPKGSSRYYFAPDGDCEKVVIYSSFPPQFIESVHRTNRLTIRKLKLPGLTEILLAVTHFPSKLHWSDPSQFAECTELSREIRKVEDEARHLRTVLVGDLNMNPYENGMLAANGLNAAMTQKVASRGKRTVAGKEYPFFYNPMWGHFGDRTEGPPGTFYHQDSGHVTPFWHILDQVLIRSDLLSCFQNGSLEILSTDGAQSFLSASSGRPDRRVASDHLPILFELNL